MVHGAGPGVGVPVRLSANEIPADEDQGQDRISIGGDGASATTRLHNRSGSGRSSVHSGKYPSGYPRSGQGVAARFSTGSSPPSGNEWPGGGSGSPGVAERGTHPSQKDYFGTLAGGGTQSGTPSSGAGGGGDGDLDDEDRFGEVGQLRSPPLSAAAMAAAMAAEQARREELRRRGSVDEKSMTMGVRGRLYVANPDPDDEQRK